MEQQSSERLLDQIGRLLAEDLEYPLDPTLLYADVQMDAVGASIFKNLGNHILYRRDVWRFCDPLLDLWEQADPKRRWQEIEYVIQGGKFEVTYTYPDQIDPDEEPFARRDRIIKRHFGDKPIVYPPWSDDDGPHWQL